MKSKIQSAFLSILLLNASCSDAPIPYVDARTILKEVQEYKLKHGRIPESLADIGRKDTEGVGPFYEKRGHDHFIIWYGTSLGSSSVFDSKVGRWEDR